MSAICQTSYFLDISPLLEQNWTGLAVVTQNLAKFLLKFRRKESKFFVRSSIISPEYVEVAVSKAPGGYLGSLISSGHAIAGTLQAELRGRPWTVGIFPNIKAFHRVFDLELLIVHDLSALLLPELHTDQAAKIHAESLTRDVRTSDLLCCVSDATRQDVLCYLRPPAERVFVSHLGVDHSLCAAELARPSSSSPPYVVVLGTIEPRKNIRLVADLIRNRPEICQETAFVFVGRRGWGKRFEEIFGDLLEDPEISRKITFTGFIPDEQKMTLLRNAKFAIFPSLFEGFGLPVIEAMAMGCPVIASRSSSMIEFGLPGKCCFDPLSLTEFNSAFSYVNSLAATKRNALVAQMRAQAGEFTWERFGERIFERLDKIRGVDIPVEPLPSGKEIALGKRVVQADALTTSRRGSRKTIPAPK